MDHPIACSLMPDQRAARKHHIKAVTLESLLARAPIDGGARLHFAADPATERAVRDIVRAEASCCGFLRFDIRRTSDALEVDVTGPDDAQPIIAELFA